MFTLEQRTDMAKKSLKKIPDVKVIAFKGLLVDYAFEHGIPVILKGVRNIRDFDYEVMMHQLSESQKLDIDTYLLPAKQDLSHISSSAAKALQQEQGLIHEYVSLYVKMCLEAKMSGQYIIGVTGEIGVGKSYISNRIEKIGNEKGIPVHNIELDHIGHQILGTLKEPIYENVREEIEKEFGPGVRLNDGSINRKALGEIVFNNKEKLERLNALLYSPLMVRLRRELYMKKGLILFNAALIAESNMAYLSNNNIILVTADKKSQKRRLMERKLTREQIKKRLESQFNMIQKKENLLAQISENSCGKLWLFDNSDLPDINDTERHKEEYELFDEIVRSVDIYGELRFKSLWKRLHISGSYQDEYDKIIQAYAESRRTYHSLSHIIHGLEYLNDIRNKLTLPDEVECAWWYHDIVYKPGSDTNEEESVFTTREVLEKTCMDETRIKQICGFILATKHPANPQSPDAGYFADIDLVILGVSYADFLDYEEKIRNEYYYIQDQKYRVERKRFLTCLLNQPFIYHTEYFRNKYEKQARENIMKLFNTLE